VLDKKSETHPRYTKKRPVVCLSFGEYRVVSLLLLLLLLLFLGDDDDDDGSI
jgi:hypothetical protein